MYKSSIGSGLVYMLVAKLDASMNQFVRPKREKVWKVASTAAAFNEFSETVSL